MNKMKIAILSSILMFLLTFNAIPSLSAEQGLGDGRISLIQGQAFIQAKEEEGWTEASVNFPVVDGDRIITEREGRVELQLQNGTYLRVGEISQLDIIALGFDRGKPFIHLNQLEGRIYVNHRPITGEDSSLYIDLPYGVLSSYVPSRFKVDLTSSEARIFVLEGSVEFKSNGRPIPLTQGKTLIAKEGGFAEVGQLYGRDEWDRWNEARDRELLQRQYAQKYLPPELEPYGYDLEGNGRWVYTPEYQYVWVPTVVVGWSPFQYGYWAWKSGIYCWVPREPWGWVPFHYGRWVSTPNHGWAWVPPPRQGIIWNPGAVAWNISSSHVSWVPLAPGEIYYGNRYYGPQSVNINQVNINIQKNVYINARVKDAVMTVQKDSFSKRNSVKITQVENPFLKAVKTSVPPTEKPVLVGEKKAPSRFINGSVGKVQSGKEPLPKELGRDNPPVEKGSKVIEQKRITESPQKKTISETAQNRVVGAVQSNRQINSSQGNSVKKDSISVPTGEKVKGENKVSTQEGNKNRSAPIVPTVIVKTPNEKELKPKDRMRVEGPNPVTQSPERKALSNMNQDRSGRIEQSSSNKENLGQRNLISLPPKDRTTVKSPNPVTQSPQRNASVNVNQNRSERVAQPNAQPSRPSQVQPLSQSQQGKALVGKPSLPESRPSSAPVSKGQAVQSNRGSTGGILGSSPLGSFH
jgi:hypothetical protein